MFSQHGWADVSVWEVKHIWINKKALVQINSRHVLICDTCAKWHHTLPLFICIDSKYYILYNPLPKTYDVSVIFSARSQVCIQVRSPDVQNRVRECRQCSEDYSMMTSSKNSEIVIQLNKQTICQYIHQFRNILTIDRLDTCYCRAYPAIPDID